jgi:hypothetical protein
MALHPPGAEGCSGMDEEGPEGSYPMTLRMALLHLDQHKGDRHL